jgi:uncharacterized glyoxalase superfamily protein PhnB
VDMSTPTPKLDLIGMVVADMATSLAFYRRLGLDIPAEADGEPHVEVLLAGGLRLAWDDEAVITSFDPSYTRETGGNRIGLAFDCGTPAGVDAVHADLTASGVTSHLAPFDAVWGQRYATVLDPDGGSVDLFAWAG